jgi:hypothetical protein
VGDAGLDGAVRDLAPLAVEHWKLPAGLDQAPLQVPPLRVGRPGALRLVASGFGSFTVTHR